MDRTYLCPVCRSARETDLSDGLSWGTHFKITLTTIFVTGLLYFYDGLPLAWRGVLLYLPLWAGAEFIHWVRMREAAKCRTCDFDPVLYRRNPAEARRRVEAKLNVFVDDLKQQIGARRALYQKAPVPPVAGDAPTEASATSVTAPVASAKNVPDKPRQNP
jgi:hypothetical protein